MELDNNNHSVFLMYYHLVLVIKYCRKVIDDKISNLIDSKTIRLPKLKDVRIKIHRQLPKEAAIKSATISKTPTGKYYISVLVEFEADIKPVRPTTETVLGLDYSSKTLFVDSQANNADYPKFYRQAEAKLKKAQRYAKDFFGIQTC